MRRNLVQIGNSRGVRIPKAMIEACGLGAQVDLRVEGNALIITPAEGPRHGWDEAFAIMAERSDDQLIWPERLDHAFDETEWRW